MDEREQDRPDHEQRSSEPGEGIVEVPGVGAVDMRAGVPREEPGEARPAGRGAPGRWQGRRSARVLAFQVLYEADVAHHPPGEVLERLLASERPGPEVAAYARELIGGVLRHRQELDTKIQERASAWPLRQMAAVDRTILRLGLYESLHQHGIVPVRVALNEAIELAKLYGGDSSPRFVNGVLGRIIESDEGRPTDRQEGP